MSDEDASWKTHISKSDIVIEAVFEDLKVRTRARSCIHSRVLMDCDAPPVASACMHAAALDTCRPPAVLHAHRTPAQVKHDVISLVEPLLKPNAVFATNTSAIPIHKIAAGAKRPERVVGMHYFSPVGGCCAR